MTTKAKQPGIATIHCEGCHATYITTLTLGGHPSNDGTPSGWSETGRSRKHPGRIAAWCPKCRYRRGGWTNPTDAEVRIIAQKMAEQDPS